MNRSNTASKDALLQERKGLLFKSRKKSSSNQKSSGDGLVDVTEWPGSEKPGGMPDWENPVEKVLCSPSIPNESGVVNLEKVHTARNQRPLLNRTSLRSQSMHEFRKPAMERKPVMVKTNHDHWLDVMHEETLPRLENMIIECEIIEESSLGDESVDESIANEKTFPCSKPQYGRNEGIGTTGRHYSRRNAHNFGPLGNTIFEGPHTIYGERPNNQGTVSEDEQHLLDLAMERSIQDFSAMSVQPVSISSDSYRKANLGSIGHNYLRPSYSDNRSAPTSLGGKFIWKREGKTWRKVPVDSHANHSRQLHESSASLALHTLYDDNDQHLDEMEQKLIEEAMQRSIDDFKIHPSPRAILDIDPDEAMSRLQELEQEKALLEMAVKRCLEGRSQRYSSSGSVVSDLSRSSFPEVESIEKKPSLSDAGCHLAMIGQSTRRLNYQSHDSAPTRGVHRHDSSDSAGTKLVWKRGPNNRWGRYPESEPADERANISEEMLVAEAMKRSLEEM